MDWKTYLLPAVLCLPLAAAGQGVYPQCLRLAQDALAVITFAQFCEEGGVAADPAARAAVRVMQERMERCDEQMSHTAKVRLQADLAADTARNPAVEVQRGKDVPAHSYCAGEGRRRVDEILKRYQP